MSSYHLDFSSCEIVAGFCESGHAKLLAQKIIAGTVENFLLNYLLCTVYDGHGLMRCKSFPVYSVFCAQPRMFSPSKVLPYKVSFLTFKAAYTHIGMQINR